MDERKEASVGAFASTPEKDARPLSTFKAVVDHTRTTNKNALAGVSLNSPGTTPSDDANAADRDIVHEKEADGPPVQREVVFRRLERRTEYGNDWRAMHELQTGSLSSRGPIVIFGPLSIK